MPSLRIIDNGAVSPVSTPAEGSTPMHPLLSIGLGSSILALSLIAAQPAHAQSETSPPGGAAPVRESIDDWTVTCAVPAVSGSTGKVCVVSQEQRMKDTGQLLLAIELRQAVQGAAATFVLPFGVALAKGATLQVDDLAASAPLPFQTCLPIGCLVPVNFDARMVASLRKGTALKVTVVSASGGEMPLSISLKGFSRALDRSVALAN
jgi:invasion protein IalB